MSGHNDTQEDNSSSIATLDNNHGIIGFHPMPTCRLNPSESDEPPSKQHKESVELRPTLQAQTFHEHFTSCWNATTSFQQDDVELIVDPFKVCVIQNFLKDETLATKILEEFNELEWNKRNLDLYEFFQSCDLKNASSTNIVKVYEFLKNDVKSWVQAITGLELTSTSATCSLYGDTDYLLIHDDQQDDRVIAFVLYLTSPRPWLETNGGALQLFSKDEAGQPFEVVRDILPCNNQFVFFQVTSDSYHQVAEVLNKNDCRMSINGWFHHKPLVYPPLLYNIPPRSLFGSHRIAPEQLDIALDMWVNDLYLDKSTTEDIQHYIEEHSQISLHDYFKEEALEGILEELQSCDITWEKVGPPNRYCYEVAVQETLPELGQRYLKLFYSSEMFALLHQYTDLELTSVRYELQRWKPGCYSLLTDYDWSKNKELDLVMFLGCPDPNSIVGGRIMYISMDEEIQDALITIEPVENCLNVVFRDTARITKYVSKYTTCPVYYLLICSYSE